MSYSFAAAGRQCRHLLSACAMLLLSSVVAAQNPSPATTAATQTSGEQLKAMEWDISQRGRPLDLSGYEETFRDDFKLLGISPDGGAGPWYAPIHGPFGAGVFDLPAGVNNPFSLVEGGLQIKAWKDGKKWHSGLMQTVDSKGNGFAQQYGYFEMTAKFPPGKGTWPAFWLLSQSAYRDKTATRVEIDVVEWYGGDAKGHHTTVHLWPAKQPKPGAVTKRAGRGKYFNMATAGLLTGGKWEGFHSYGAEITPQWVIIYLDRKELERFPMVSEFHTPMYLLVDLAVLEKEEPAALSPMEMVVSNVTVWKKK